MEALMLTQVQKQFIFDLYTATGVPLLLFYEDGSELAAFPEHFGNTLSIDFLRGIPSDLAASRHPSGVLLLSWGNLYSSACTRLGNGMFLLTAPATTSAHSEFSLFEMLSGMVRPSRLMDFCHFISEIPPIGRTQMSKLVSIVKQFITGNSVDGISTKETIPPKADSFTLPEQQIPTGFRHVTNYEDDIVTAIENGDISRLSQAYHRPLNGHIGRMSLNDLRQAKYCFVCFMFMASRAAVKGGLPLELAMQMSDLYCQRMDEITSVQTINTLTYTALEDFCRKTAEYLGYGQYHSVTRLCCEYIGQHLYESISVNDIADYCKLAPRSITRYFKRDIGVSIPEYINHRRLEEARYLLVSTTLSLSQISQLLCYSSQSYLGKLFLQTYGMPPSEYRKKNFRT